MTTFYDQAIVFPHIAVCEDISVMGMILTKCESVINASLDSCATGNNEEEINGKYFFVKSHTVNVYSFESH